ncbi:unnamed protein product [Soboliphyme baturini]|uniref:Nuclear pore complex protein n=1 Tax=Soboliphyme baturini TaxID=241478 RepID=A0A183IM35_9BILA|nr:unnamed protein product [Soboliphyme baturini]
MDPDAQMRLGKLLDDVDEPSLSSAERATYGVLTGHLDSLLAMSNCWEDKLWAHCKSLSEQMFDEFRSGMATSASSPALRFSQIFPKLGLSDDDFKGGFFCNVQKFLALRHYDALIRYLDNAMSQNSAFNRHRARFSCHLVFQLRSFGVDIEERTYNLLIEHYVKVLISDRRVSLIPFYVSKLRRDLQILWYAKFLEDVFDSSERQRYLAQAREHNLDVYSICLAVAEQLRKHYLALVGNSGHPETGSLTTSEFSLRKSVTEDEEKVISAIEWLLFEPDMLMAEAVREAGALGRVFLLNENLAAVEKLFDILPDNADEAAIDIWKEQNDDASGALTTEQKNILKDYHSIRIYIVG